MPFNGAGLYAPPGADYPVAPNTLIQSALYNDLIADIATALSLAITKDGQQVVTNNIPMANFVFTGLGSGIASRTRSANIGDVQDGLSNWVVAAGTADAITAAYAPAITVLVDGQVCSFRALLTNLTNTPTFAPNGIAAHTITKLGGGPLQPGDIAGVLSEVVLRYNLANTRWELLNPTKLNTGHAGGIINGTIVTTRGANAETIAVKTLAGNDPSPADPVLAVFRDTAAGTGGLTVLPIVAALSLVISSGSTLGFTNAVTGRIWAVIFNDAGTARLGVINCLSTVAGAGAGRDVTATYPLGQQLIASSTAEGGAGAADNSQIFYTGIAVASKAYCVAGYLEYTLAAAGTWVTAPGKVQLYGAGVPLPGTVLQTQRNDNGAVATGTTLIPYDDTVPQNTEGDQYLSQAITPTSAANALRIRYQIAFTQGSGTPNCISALFQDTTVNALKVAEVDPSAVSFAMVFVEDALILSGLSVATTFKVRAGTQSGATLTVNGSSGARKFGGTYNTYIEIQEIVA